LVNELQSQGLARPAAAFFDGRAVCTREFAAAPCGDKRRGFHAGSTAMSNTRKLFCAGITLNSSELQCNAMLTTNLVDARASEFINQINFAARARCYGSAWSGSAGP
jgi:hypothetical protein